MKVAVHADPIGHGIPGGVGVYVGSLVAALREHVDPVLWAARGTRLPAAVSDLPVRRSPLPLRASYAATNWLRLPMPFGAADVVHATNLVVPRTRRPLVATVHDLTVDRYPEMVPQPWRALYRRGLDIACEHADMICTVSAATAGALTETRGVSSDRLAVTPLGPHVTPDDAADASALSRLGVRSPYLLTVGTLEPRKDQVTLVRAFAAAAHMRDWQLVLAGQPGWGSDAVLAAIDASGVSERIVRAGGVGPAELVALYAGADAFALPSAYEGFGIPLLEAMGFGIPAVASSIEALREVGGDAVRYVPVGDVAALAGVLDELATNDAERARLSAAARTRASIFGWDRTATATVAAYEQALSR